MSSSLRAVVWIPISAEKTNRKSEPNGSPFKYIEIPFSKGMS
ncbi:hypothetical protein [Psychroserpens luteus]|uniref:Uncharacterized protein n=1 Tax=Psychroserpens luteus TaxID=1434066 RepID=A0ABW5ZY25_9FLAO|nr:hypothetical protein [Psychroserpens luteus]